MKNGKSTFLFIRHAESEKNRRDITSGPGEPLTKTGVQQSVGLANRLRSELSDAHNLAIVASSAIQSQQTAREIASRLSLTYEVSEAITPLGLGIADGLSGEQISQLYPDVSSRLSSWRKREIEAIDLNIPGMEALTQFWARVLGFINKGESGATYVVVCTRSVMVLAANLVSGNRPERGGGYIHYPIYHCDVIAFTYHSGGQGTRLADYSIEPIDGLTTANLEAKRGG